MSHYWVDRYLNNQPTGIWIFEGAEELVRGVNELIVEAGKELSVPVSAEVYGMQSCVAITNTRFNNQIRYEIDHAYTEEEMIEAGLLGPITLDANVWGQIFELSH